MSHRPIKLELTRHCVETEINRLYNLRLSDSFKHDADKAAIEKDIEALTRALETLDFAKLRNTFPELAGHGDDDIHLTADSRGRIRLIINKREIDPGEI